MSLEGKVRDSAELARLGRLMNGATQSLTSLRDPKDVIAQGTLAMFELAGSGFRGASYLRVSDGVVTQEAVADGRGTVPTSYLLKDDPYVKAVVDNGETSGHRGSTGPPWARRCVRSPTKWASPTPRSFPSR